MGLNWYGGQVTREIRAAAADALEIAAEHLKTESQRVVPIEEATLERSAFVDVDAGELRAAVSYDTPYAVKQHEDLTLGHDPGRQAKYLEEPANREAKVIGNIIGREMRRRL